MKESWEEDDFHSFLLLPRIAWVFGGWREEVNKKMTHSRFLALSFLGSYLSLGDCTRFINHVGCQYEWQWE
jgi:hypothetical protein